MEDIIGLLGAAKAESIAALNGTDTNTMALMVTSPVKIAMLDAVIEFAGRDRRRVKRETRKAGRRARRVVICTGKGNGSE